MIFITLNKVEKFKLIEILQKDDSAEARQIISRINSAISFLGQNQDENIFNFYHCKREIFTPVPSENTTILSGIKIEYEPV